MRMCDVDSNNLQINYYRYKKYKKRFDFGIHETPIY